MIKYLNVTAKGFSTLPTLNGQNEPALNITLEDVELFGLMSNLIKVHGANKVLEQFYAHDIELYLKGGENE